MSITFIGLLTYMVAEFAELFGCAAGLPDAVTAISFVALGTSLPDTFASRQAAMESEDADAAIGNVTGSNSVNVFLGLGAPSLNHFHGLAVLCPLQRRVSALWDDGVTDKDMTLRHTCYTMTVCTQPVH